MSSKRFKSVFEQQLSNDKEWNMVVAYFQLVIDRIKSVDESSTTGELDGWYRNLRTLWRNIKHMVQLPEGESEKSVDELFELVLKDLTGEVSDEGIYKLKQGRAEDKLDKLNVFIYGLLHGSNLVIPEKQDFDPLDEESQSFGGAR